MSDQTIEGTINNGRRGVAKLPFYTGDVGIRERDGWLEIAFFSAPIRLKSLPTEGSIDGQPVQITAVRARDLNADVAAKVNDRTPRIIVASAVPLA